MRQYRLNLFSKDFVFQNTLECQNDPELYYDYITAEKSTLTVANRPYITRGDFAIVLMNNRKIYEGYVTNYEYTSDEKTTITLMPLLYLFSRDIYTDIRLLNNKLETIEQLTTRCIRMLYASNDETMDISGLTFVNEEGDATNGEYDESSDRIYNLLDLLVDFFKKYGFIVTPWLDPNNKKLYIQYNYVNDYKINRIKASYSDVFEYSWNNANDSDKPNKITYYNQNYFKAADAITYLKGKVRSNTDFDKDYKSSILSNISTVIDSCELSANGEMTCDITAVKENTTSVTKNKSHNITVTDSAKGITVDTAEDTTEDTDASGNKTTSTTKTVTTTWTKLSPLPPDKFESSYSKTTTHKYSKTSKEVATVKKVSEYSKTITQTVTKNQNGSVTQNQVDSDTEYTKSTWTMSNLNTVKHTDNHQYTTERAGDTAGNWTEVYSYTDANTPDAQSPVKPNSTTVSNTSTYNRSKDQRVDGDDGTITNENTPEYSNTGTVTSETTDADMTYLPTSMTASARSELIATINRYNETTTPDEGRSGTEQQFIYQDGNRIKDTYTGGYVTSVSYSKKTTVSTNRDSNGRSATTTKTVWSWNWSDEATTETGFIDEYTTASSETISESTTEKVTHSEYDSNGDVVQSTVETKHDVEMETNLDSSGQSGTYGDWSRSEKTTVTKTEGEKSSTHTETINTEFKRNTGTTVVTTNYVSPISDPYADTNTYEKTVTDDFTDAPIVDKKSNTTTQKKWNFETVTDKAGRVLSESKTESVTVSSSKTNQGTIKTISRKRVDRTTTQNGEITSQSSQLTEETVAKTSVDEVTETVDTTISADGSLDTQEDDIQPYALPSDETIPWTKTIKESSKTVIAETGETTSADTTTKYTYSPDQKQTVVTSEDDKEDDGILTLHIWQNIEGQKYQKNWDWNEWLDYVERKAMALDVSVIYYYHPDNNSMGGGEVTTDGTENRVFPVFASMKTAAPSEEEKDQDGFVTKAAKTFKEVAYDDAYEEMYTDRYDDYLVLTVNRNTKLYTVDDIGTLYTIKIDDITYNTILTGYQIVSDAEIKLTFGMQRQSLTQRLREMDKKIEGRK